MSSSKNVLILCSGNGGNKSLEDDVCAGLLIARLLQEQSNFNKIDKVEKNIKNQALNWKDNLCGMMNQSTHGQYLKNQGFEKDLKFCSELNKSYIIPQLVNNRII
jgi:2-phosphosulfolactate phosphatase